MANLPHQGGNDNRSLAATSARGGLLMLVAQGTVFAANFAGIVILARMLTPQMFGIMAMAATVANFIMMFRDFGLTTPVMQHRELSHEQISTLYWANVGFGLLLTALAIAAAPAFAWFYDTPDLTLIVAVLASGFLLATGGAMQDALLRRHMKYRALAIIRIMASLAALASGVVVAWAGHGIWALVAMRLVQQACFGAGAWIASPWRPGFHLRASGMRALLGTAGHVSGSQLAGYLSRNADNVLIGWYWGSHALGLYDQAYRLLLFPMQQLGAPLNSVLLPLLSRLAQQPDAYRSTYRRVAEKLVMLTMPLTCLMLILPQTVVDVALGPQWTEAAPIIAWLGVAMIYQPLAFTTNCLLISQNRSGLLLRNSLISAALSVIAFIVGLPYGPVGVAASYAMSGLFIRMPFTFWQVGREGPVSLRDQLSLFVPSLWSGAVLATAFHFLGTVPFLAAHPVWLLGAAALVALPVTAAALAFLPSGRALMADSLTMTKLALTRQNRRAA